MTHSLTVDEFLANPNQGLSEFISVDAMKQTVEESVWNFHQSVFSHTMKVLGVVDRIISLETPHLDLLRPVKRELSVYMDAPMVTHSRRILLKVSALLHDLGKVFVIRTGEEQEGTACPEHAEESRKLFESKIGLLPLPFREQKYVAEIIGKHHKAENFLCCQGEEDCDIEFHKYREENEQILIDLLVFYLCDFEGSKVDFMVLRQKPIVFRKICSILLETFLWRRNRILI